MFSSLARVSPFLLAHVMGMAAIAFPWYNTEVKRRGFKVAA